MTPTSGKIIHLSLPSNRNFLFRAVDGRRIESKIVTTDSQPTNIKLGLRVAPCIVNTVKTGLSMPFGPYSAATISTVNNATATTLIDMLRLLAERRSIPKRRNTQAPANATATTTNGNEFSW
ncbi:unannotated protein [freshwater metagenome]|uniref:Unannotated protein n=1 Tax=freshwater metagenome TaxID=449393 RepID=A0A6J7UIN4_9ZZZZ